MGQSDIKWEPRSGKQVDEGETVDDRDSACGELAWAKVSGEGLGK